MHFRRRLAFLEDCIARLEGGIPRPQFEAIMAELRALDREADLVEHRLETWQTLYDTLRDMVGGEALDQVDGESGTQRFAG